MIALSKISQQTNYEWLIKPHPDDEFIEQNYFSEMKKKVKNAKILPAKLNKISQVEISRFLLSKVEWSGFWMRSVEMSS